ncbi:hypothetical protein KSP40_PGU002708 [Platanthera guangdongensis]|uniref:Uncharacterized protein n=1 Tax=Platanthera guangdongensis TaxID=2320717 RepID=A0ABR2MJB3_9ASPA
MQLSGTSSEVYPMALLMLDLKISIMQFEWAWQHPTESLAVRKAASSFKSLSGIANKIKLAYTMLTLSCWENLKITVNFFSTKYTKYIAGCPRLPNQMRLDICGMEDLHCYVEGQAFQSSEADEEEDDGETNIDPELASAGLTPSSPSEDAGIGKAGLSTNQSTPRSSDNEEVSLSPEINVINLCTPSSSIIRSKTKRALFDSDIVDLTDSPVVIQL